MYTVQGQTKTKLGLMLLPRKGPISSRHSRPTKKSNTPGLRRNHSLLNAVTYYNGIIGVGK